MERRYGFINHLFHCPTKRYGVLQGITITPILLVGRSTERFRFHLRLIHLKLFAVLFQISIIFIVIIMFAAR